MFEGLLKKNEAYVNSDTDHFGVTTIAFYHPAQNSLPANLLHQLAEAIEAAGINPDTKVIVLKSDGDHAFCAGASFDELLQIKTKEEGKNFFMGFANVINACRKSPRIIIGRVYGKAIGGGVGIAAACDYCLATQNAEIKQSELSIGIGPLVVGPAIIRKIGLNAFSRLSLNATDYYSALWAKDKGLYAEVYERRKDMDKAIEVLAMKIAEWNPQALAVHKKTLWEGTENWDELLAERAAINGELVLSPLAQNTIQNIKPGIKK
ncbi:enoyl-CoA hydratase/isomerase family protein [Mucilaginibacter sp. HMF5004]|uniref:enoyl-CoA hydratase/isomerase family protein n=1 Tax=Mucilaginibacter rivuli TaxID=2857527 RepID=UPI001C5CC9A2|nr:enoyl-CoA hydratase/isomerase family protein [Mucilaginibacter rivuli]MBW4889159.1 enoyl-CoA hydratase/isomerase family protein [Mucilaginibacter rivuli]